MTNPDQLALKAGELYRSNRIDEALVLLEKSLALQASHGLSLEYKGLALQRLGKFEEAMTCWDLLIANKGEVAMYFGERGVCKFNLGYKSALADFNRAAELEPSNPYRYSSRAYVKDKTGDIRSAIEDYQKCIELDPEDAIALNNLGIAEQKIGNMRRAEDFFNIADEKAGIGPRDQEVLQEKAERVQITEKVQEKQWTRSEKWKFIWTELRSMLSSRKGFSDFLSDLRKRQ